MPLRIARHYTELIKEARIVEEEGDIEKAAQLYEEAVKQEPFDEHPYKRLMIIYRKLKQNKDELRIITKALKIYQGHYDKIPENFIARNPKLVKTSKALLKSVSVNTGSKAGNYYPPPIPEWIGRKQTVEKKIKK